MPTLNRVNAADYGLIGLYFAIVIFVGFYAARKNRNTKDFFEAGGQVPWFMAGVSNWVAGFSAFMFVAAAGYTYRTGLGALVIFTSAFWAYLGGHFIFAPLWRRARIRAPLEFLTRRYSPSTTYFYTVTAILPQVFTLAIGLYILCIFVSAALGFEHAVVHLAGLTLSGLQASMLVIGAVMIIYSSAGGLWAAVLSDSIQGVIILVMSVIILPLSLRYLGAGHGQGGIYAGVQRLFRELPHDYLVPGGQFASPLFMGTYMLAVFLNYNVSWHQAQRYNSVRSERAAKKMALLCAGLALCAPLLWVLPVIGAKLIFPDLHALWPSLKAPEEASFVSLALLLLPHGMIGFVVAAIISATLGQANDIFNWLASAIARDVYVPVRRQLGYPECSDRQQMRIAQAAMLVVGAAGVTLALFISKLGGAFDFGLKYQSVIGPVFVTPVALGLIYRKTPWWSGMASCGAALASALFFFNLKASPTHAFALNTLGAIGGGTLMFAISAFWYRADDPASAEAIRLDRDLRTPVPEPTGAEGHGTNQVYGIIGIISALLGLVMLACWFLPSSRTAPASINVVAGVLLLLIGAVLRWQSRARA